MESRTKYYLVAQSGMAVIYHFTMCLSPFAPVELPLTVFDHLASYNDLFGVLYLSFFLLIFYSIRFTSVPVSAVCTKAILTTAVGCGIFFIFYPTFYNETAAPEKPSFIYHIVKDFDRNKNCFPSLHIAVSAVCCYYAGLQKSAGIKCLLGIWFLLLFVSVLGTKQHYFYDALGGMLVGIVVIFATNFYLYKSLFLKIN